MRMIATEFMFALKFNYFSRMQYYVTRVLQQKYTRHRSKMKHQCNKKEYFSNLLKNLQQHNQQHGLQLTSYHWVLSNSKKCIQQAYNSILCGILQLNEQPDKLSDIIIQPQHKNVSSDISEIDKKIQQNEQMLRQAKRQMLIHKRQQQEVMKLQNEIKVRENQEKIRQWMEKQKVYDKNRLKLFQKRQHAIQQEDQRQREHQQLQKQQEIQQRRDSLQSRARLMQQQKQRRRQIFSLGQQQSRRIPQPKFKQIQQKFQKVMAQKAFQKQIIKKNIKISKQLNIDAINQHQKQYIQKLQDRIKEKGYTSMKQLNQQEMQLHQSRFNNSIKRNNQQIQQQRQRLNRRMSYQSRLQQIELNIDDSKKMNMEITKDKAKNPLKYNFLKQKHLNDYQIYTEFKDFILDVDRNQIGNQYLREARKIGEDSRLRKSHSVSAVSLKQKDKQQKYINYLPEIKARNSAYDSTENLFKSQKTIKEVFKKQSNPSRALQKISLSLKKYDNSIANKKIQLKSLNMISSTLRKEREIDEMYMKSLKAKLACLEIQQ